MPTRLIFFACKVVASFRDVKKLSVVPQADLCSASPPSPDIETRSAYIWSRHLQPIKFDAKFIRLIPHILGELTGGLCGEQLLINRDDAAGFVAGYTVLDEPVPSGPHQGKLVVLQTHTLGLLSIKSQGPH